MDGVAGALAEVRHKQGKHLGKMEALGFDLRTEAGLAALTDEVVTSSAIEGESLNTREVRSSIARRLGLDAGGLPKPGRAVEGIVEMMLDATRDFDKPLTAERLYGWHAALSSRETITLVIASSGRYSRGWISRGESGSSSRPSLRR